jgi:drug/metabolite transporter (DMT)-like permease
MVFAAVFLGEPVSIRYSISFVLVLSAVAVAFYK